MTMNRHTRHVVTPLNRDQQMPGSQQPTCNSFFVATITRLQIFDLELD